MELAEAPPGRNVLPVTVPLQYYRLLFAPEYSRRDNFFSRCSANAALLRIQTGELAELRGVEV